MFISFASIIVHQNATVARALPGPHWGRLQCFRRFRINLDLTGFKRERKRGKEKDRKSAK